MVEHEGADESSFFPMVVPFTIGRWSPLTPSGDAGSQASVFAVCDWNLACCRKAISVFCKCVPASRVFRLRGGRTPCVVDRGLNAYACHIL